MDTQDTSKSIAIHVEGEAGYEATSVFNANAFPSDVENLVRSGSDYLSLFLYSVSLVEPYIKKDINLFLVDLRTNQVWDGFVPDPRYRCWYHNVSFLMPLQLVLSSAKSFLDIYSRLVSRLIVPKSELYGFNEGIVDGRKVKGGRLVNWVRSNSPRNYTNSTRLIGVLKEHIFMWIDEIVKWRDQLIHEEQLLKMCAMWTPLHINPSEVKEHNIVTPQMPNGVDAVTYCEQTRKNLLRFIKETVTLLPKINLALVSFPS